MAGIKFADELVGKPQPSKSERFKAVAENPIAVSQWFKRIMDAVFRDVLGINPLDGNSFPNGGLFGRVYAYAGGIEQQARLSLHIHILVWIAGFPTTTSQVESSLADEISLTSITRLVNSVVTSSYGISDDITCSNCKSGASHLDFIPNDDINHASSPLPKTSMEEPTVVCRICSTKHAAGNIVLDAATKIQPCFAEQVPSDAEKLLHAYIR